jgi:glutamate dehydrogenase
MASRFPAIIRKPIPARPRWRPRDRQRLGEGRPLCIDFHHQVPDRTEIAGLKLFRLGNPVPLSERVPILENMGFKVINERFPDRPPRRDRRTERIWLHDMVLERADGEPIDLEALGEPLEACFMAVARAGGK